MGFTQSKNRIMDTTYQITLTDAAKEAIRARLDSTNSFMRIGVKSGSCDGFSYALEFDNVAQTEKDLLFEFDDIKLLIDNKSIQYLNELVVDYKKSLIEEGFQFINKLAKSECGCGRSFSI